MAGRAHLVVASACVVAAGGLQFLGCGSSSRGSGGGPAPAASTAPVSTAPWPASPSAVLDATYQDPAGDLTLAHPGDRPPALIPFAPVDVIRLELGCDEHFLYMRVQFAAPIPTAPVPIPAQGGMPAQTMQGQSLSVVIDVDRDQQTGGGASPWLEGVDIFFAHSIRYGQATHIYANYDYEGGDLHRHRGQVVGELREGGPGFDYLYVRYDLSQIRSGFRPSGLVPVGCWSEAESELYHEAAADSVLEQATWLCD